MDEATPAGVVQRYSAAVIAGDEAAAAAYLTDATKPTRENERSRLKTLVIGQRERIALPISPRRCTRVVTKARWSWSASASCSRGSSSSNGRSTSWSAIDVGAELADHEAGARGVGRAHAVEALPAVHVVGGDGEVALEELRGRDGGRADEREVGERRPRAPRAARRAGRAAPARRRAPPCARASARAALRASSEIPRSRPGDIETMIGRAAGRSEAARFRARAPHPAAEDSGTPRRAPGNRRPKARAAGGRYLRRHGPALQEPARAAPGRPGRPRGRRRPSGGRGGGGGVSRPLARGVRARGAPRRARARPRAAAARSCSAPADAARACGSPTGRGALDFMGGLGVYVFGHADRDLLETAVVAAAGDTVFQGHLAPGPEYLAPLRGAAAPRRQAPPPRLALVSGAMANENALKIDPPEARAGRPDRRLRARLRGPHDRRWRSSPTRPPTARASRCAATCCTCRSGTSRRARPSARRARSTRTSRAIRAGWRRCSSSWCRARAASTPRRASSSRALMERCRAAGVAVWIDEVQTFARTGELFAFKTLGLEDYVGRRHRAARCCRAAPRSSRARYNPKPGLVAGTFAGSTVGHGGRRAHHRAARARGLPRPRGPRRGARRAASSAASRRSRGACRARSARAAASARCTRSCRSTAASAVVQAVIRAAFEEGLLVWSAGHAPGEDPLAAAREHHRRGARGRLRDAREGAAPRRRRARPAVLILRPDRAIRATSRRAARALARAARLDEPARRPGLPGRPHRGVAALVRAARSPTGARASTCSCSRTPTRGRCVGTSHDPRQARPPGQAVLLARGDRPRSGAAPSSAALRAQEAPAALDRGRPDRDRRPDPRPVLSPPPARAAARRSRSCASRASRRIPERFEREVIAEMLSPFVAPGPQPALGRVRRALHRPLLPRGRPPLVAHQAVHRGSLPARSRLRDALPRARCRSRDRQAERHRAWRRCASSRRSASDPLNQVDPFDGGPYYGASRDAIVVGARAPRARAAGPRAPRRAAHRRRARSALAARAGTASAPPWCRSTPTARPYVSQRVRATRSASRAATA